MKNSLRNSNIELLRLFAMFLIVLSHISFNFLDDLSLSVKMVDFLTSVWGKLGVNIFIIISIKFLLKQEFKFSRLFSTLKKMYFYGILLSILALFSIFSTKDFIVFIIYIPIKYWFVSAYLILIAIIPYIKKFLSLLSKKQVLILTVGMFILFSVIPTVFMINLGMGRIIIFLMFICFIYYFDEYNIHLENKFLMQSLIFSISCFILLMSISLYSNINFSVFTTKSHFLFENNIFQVMISLILVLFVFNLKPKAIPFFNNISSRIFSVYLIHTHPFFVSLLNDVITSIKIKNGLFLFLVKLVLSAFIIILCIFVDKVIDWCSNRINLKNNLQKFFQS